MNQTQTGTKKSRRRKNGETPVFSELTPDEKLKYEVAEELGLLDKVLREGWKSLSSRETGRIGGIVNQKKRRERRQEKES